MRKSILILIPILLLTLSAQVILAETDDSNAESYSVLISEADDGKTFSYTIGDNLTFQSYGNGGTYGYKVTSYSGGPSWLTYSGLSQTDLFNLTGTATSSGTWTIRMDLSMVNAYGTVMDSWAITWTLTIPEQTKFTVTFDNSDGTSVPSQEVVMGNSITLPSAVHGTVSGSYGYTLTFTFLGWAETEYYSSSVTILEAGSTYTPTANTTLYAIYYLTGTATCTIKYTGTVTTGTLPSDQSVTLTKTATGHSADLALVNPINLYGSATVADGSGLTYEGRSFAGWKLISTDSSTQAVVIGQVYTDTILCVPNIYTMEATWAYYVHTLHYSANGGYDAPSDTKITSENWTDDVPVASGKPIKTLGTFASWNTLADGTGTTYVYGDSVPVGANSTITLYAQWTDLDTVTIDLAPGTIITSNSTSLLTDGSYTQPYSSSEMAFLWSLVPNGYTVNRSTTNSGTGWVFMPHIGEASEIVDYLIEKGYYTGQDSITVYLNGVIPVTSTAWTLNWETGPITGYYTTTYNPSVNAEYMVITYTIDPQSRETYYSAKIYYSDGTSTANLDIRYYWLCWGSYDTGNWPSSTYITNKGNTTLTTKLSLVNSLDIHPTVDEDVVISGTSVERVWGIPYVSSSDGIFLWSAVPSGYSVGPETTASEIPSGWVFMPYVASLEDAYNNLLDSMLDSETLETLQSDGGQVTLNFMGPLVVKHDRWTYETFSINHGISTFRGGYMTLAYSQTEASYAIVDYETNLTLLYSENGTLLSTGYLSEYDILWGSRDTGNLSSNSSAYSYLAGSDKGSASLSPYVEVTVAEKDISYFMDISQGVRVTTTAGASWTNGYKTGAMTIVFHSEKDARETVSFTWGDGQNATLTLIRSSGTVAITTNLNGSASVYNLGVWTNFQVSIDLQTGQITVETIQKDSWQNFQVYTPTGVTTVLGTFNPAPTDYLTSVTFYKIGNYSTFYQEVSETSVVLDTYNVVLYDASLDITKFFPDMSDMRLNFYSFSMYGNSIVINGVTYDVDKSTGKVSIGTGHTLSNLYLTYSPVTDKDGNTATHVFITFVNDNTTYDLGAVSTYKVTFNGMWYFTTGLWEGHDAVRESYNWDFWHVNATENELVLLFVGWSILISLLTVSFLRDTISIRDLIIVAGGVIVSLTLLVV